MNLENRYTVLKNKDIAESLSTIEIGRLDFICFTIDKCRIYNRRGKFKCIVIEEDWPEYEIVLEMLKKRINEELEISEGQKTYCGQDI